MLDGALSGAYIGGMVGGIAAPFFVACFAAGEHIWTEHGSQPIETFKVADVVLSRDEFNVDGPLVAKRIEETFERTGELFLLTVNGTQFKTTAEHPFYSKERGWIPAGELKLGEELSNADGTWSKVDAFEATGRIATLYNFRVADFHTYFVGKRLEV